MKSVRQIHLWEVLAGGLGAGAATASAYWLGIFSLWTSHDLLMFWLGWASGSAVLWFAGTRR